MIFLFFFFFQESAKGILAGFAHIYFCFQKIHLLQMQTKQIHLLFFFIYCFFLEIPIELIFKKLFVYCLYV